MSTATVDNLAAAVEEIFLVLSEKERNVIKKRFALANEEKHTLEAIGQEFGVTRERVRQIESIALQKLRRTIDSTSLKHVNNRAKEILQSHGEVMLEEKLISKVLHSINSTSEVDGSIIRLSLAIDDEVRKQDRTHQFKPFWRAARINLSEIATVANKAASVLGKQKDVMLEDQLVNTVRADLANKGKNFDTTLIRSVLDLDHRLKKTESGWGLMTWRHINPRSIRDKALLVMRREQKPMHFVEIANAITDFGFDRKMVTVQAVHNELIREENFVLIGRGLYALSEWGYSEGTVSDIIEALLDEHGEMTKDEIIQGVLRQRQVKKGTISLNLQKTPWFVRTGRAVYRLDLTKKPEDPLAGKRRRRG